MEGEWPGEESVLRSSLVPEPVLFSIRGSIDENESGERLKKERGKSFVFVFASPLCDTLAMYDLIELIYCSMLFLQIMERSVTSKLLLLPDLIKALRNIATSCMLQLSFSYKP